MQHSKKAEPSTQLSETPAKQYFWGQTVESQLCSYGFVWATFFEVWGGGTHQPDVPHICALSPGYFWNAKLKTLSGDPWMRFENAIWEFEKNAFPGLKCVPPPNQNHASCHHRDGTEILILASVFVAPGDQRCSSQIWFFQTSGLVFFWGGGGLGTTVWWCSGQIPGSACRNYSWCIWGAMQDAELRCWFQARYPQRLWHSWLSFLLLFVVIGYWELLWVKTPKIFFWIFQMKWAIGHGFKHCPGSSAVI